MKVTVKVTDEMGAQRNRALGFGCMVRQAMNPICDANVFILVGLKTIFFGGPYDEIPLPPEESDRIRRYDNGFDVPAHEFEMEIPVKYLKPHVGK